MKNLKVLHTRFLSDEKLQLITGQIFVGQAILVAYELGLFQLLAKHSLSLQQIADAMNLHKRAAQALIACSSALNLVESKKNRYILSSIGKMYLDNKSLSYYGKVLDLLIQENEIMNYENVKNAIKSNNSQIGCGKKLFSNKNSVGNTKEFVASLHYKAFNPAFYWARTTNLKGSKRFVDIGGGSGIHTIAACLNHKQLLGTVCDRPSVVSYTQKYIKEFSLDKRIKVYKLDMWKDPFPLGDVYFLGDIFHDWPKEQCLFLAKKCFKSLPKKGQIILHEMLFNESKTGPFLTSAYNMKMMLWTEGQQFTRNELKALLKTAGFKQVKIKKSLGNWSLIIGIK